VQEREVDVARYVGWEVRSEGLFRAQFALAVEGGEGGERGNEDAEVGDRHEEREVVHGGGMVVRRFGRLCGEKVWWECPPLESLICTHCLGVH